MRAVCMEFGLDLQFDENVATELVLESPELFRRFVTGLWNQSNGGDEMIIISEADKELRFEKNAEIITDPFHIDLNNRKLLTKIYQNIVREQQERSFDDYARMNTLLEQYVMALCDHSEYPLTYTSDVDFVDILKVYNVRIDIEETDFVDRLISYVKLSNKVLGTSLFVLINLRTYLSDDMMSLLCNTLLYEKVNILFIERYAALENKHIKRVIIDKEYCLIDNDR